MSKDKLGDYLKTFEKIETSRKADPSVPLMARLDGRSFHSFTKHLEKPFDSGLSSLMRALCRYLIETSHADLGFTQSDEITLCWFPKELATSQLIFGGKFHKLTSILAGEASGWFNFNKFSFLSNIPDKVQCFDARVWSVPLLTDAYLNFVWRELDAIKNSISMVAQHHFSHKSLDKVGSAEKIEMLKDIDNWHDYRMSYKRGSYYARRILTMHLTDGELASIPIKYQPTEPVTRHKVMVLEPPILHNATDEDRAKHREIIFQI